MNKRNNQFKNQVMKKIKVLIRAIIMVSNRASVVNKYLIKK